MLVTISKEMSGRQRVTGKDSTAQEDKIGMLKES